MRYVTVSTLIASAGLWIGNDEVGAQGQVLDRGTFVVSENERVVGKENFVLRSGTSSGSGGFTLTVNAHYPASRATPIMVSNIEFGPDSEPTVARLDLDEGEHPSIFVAMTPRRVTVRRVTPRGESARQFPAVARAMLVDEFMISSYMVLPGRRGSEVTVINPRSGLTLLTSLDDRGLDTVQVHGVERELQHFALGSGTEVRHIWYDSAGRLVMVEDRMRGRVALRSLQR